MPAGALAPARVERPRRLGAAGLVSCSAVLVSAAALALPACGQANEVPTQSMPGEAGNAAQVAVERPAWTSQLGGVRERTRTVIRDSASWRAFWDAFAGARAPRPEPPDVDFERQIVVFAAMGRQSSAGYDIAIENVYEEDGALRVEVVETAPASGCLTAQVMTAPVTAVLVPARPGEITFIERRETRSC